MPSRLILQLSFYPSKGLLVTKTTDTLEGFIFVFNSKMGSILEQFEFDSPFGLHPTDGADMKNIKVYLAGQANEYENDWKEVVKTVEGFDFHDWEFDSDQTSPDTYFPDDLRAISEADILVANPGIAPSEATWIEIGYFLALNTNKPGDTCDRLIIIWQDKRQPKWSIEFVAKAGIVVNSLDEAIEELEKIK